MTAGLRWLLGASIGLAALLLLGSAGSFLFLAFGAVLIAGFFSGCATWLAERTGLRYGLSFAIVLVVIALALAGLFALSYSRIANESDRLTRELPRAAAQVAERFSHYRWVQRVIEELPTPGDLATPQVFQQATGIFSSLVGAVAGALIVLVMAIFLAADPPLYRRGVLRLVPLPRREQALRVLNAVGDVLWLWMMAKLASMAVIGILTYIGLLILGVPLASTLALIAGVLAFIPNFGPILAGIPAVLLAFAEGPAKALQVLALYLIVQAVEGNLVTPIIERKTVKLPPALTIAVQILLGLVAGGLGLMVASPLCAAGMVIVQEVYVKDTLGDDFSDQTLPPSMRTPEEIPPAVAARRN